MELFIIERPKYAIKKQIVPKQNLKHIHIRNKANSNLNKAKLGKQNVFFRRTTLIYVKF